MNIKYQKQDDFYNDFLPLIIELECGSHYDSTNNQHVEWLKTRITSLFMSNAKAICLYETDDVPVGFILILHDKGLEGVGCFRKKATIAMFGLLPEFRSKGIGQTLIEETERYIKEWNGECIYVDTYAQNSGAIRFYTKCGFIPVAYHPYENGVDDKGQVYLCKELL